MTDSAHLISATPAPHTPATVCSDRSAVPDPADRLLEQTETPVSSAALRLSSGRRYELEAGSPVDHLIVRARSGEVVLRIDVSDAGPVLSFKAAQLELTATGHVAIRGESVEISAERDLSLASGGDQHDLVAGARHSRIEGEDRLEASSIAIQASAGALRAKACEGIYLDADRIGLNDDPLPQPFPWSSLADDLAREEAVLPAPPSPAAPRPIPLPPPGDR